MKSLMSNTIIHKTILVFLVVLLCLFRFGHIYYDSIQYIWYAQYFAGRQILLISTAMPTDMYVVRAPFVYRPLIPFFIGFFGGSDSHIYMSLLNVIVLCMMTSVLYDFGTEFEGSGVMTFLGTGLAMISYPVMYYGPVPLVDTMAMLIFVLIIGGAEYDWGDNITTVVLIIGVLIKEIILILGLFYIFRRGFKKLWVLIPATCVHLSLRFILGFVNNLIFTTNIFERPIEVAGMFVITFILPVLIIGICHLKNYRGNEQFLISGLIVCMLLMCLGLFFAYFDGRFLWPLLIIIGLYIASMKRYR